MPTICFNTGRKYTANGQRIIATLHEDGEVTFYDIDRCVDGQFTLKGEFDKRTVMLAYDTYQAPNTVRSWQDAMMKGGCNTSDNYKR